MGFVVTTPTAGVLRASIRGTLRGSAPEAVGEAVGVKEAQDDA